MQNRPQNGRHSLVDCPLEDEMEGHAGRRDAGLDDPVRTAPATRGQLRLWRLDRVNPGNPALNMPLIWQCTGALDPVILSRAFSLCAARHETLRTTFAMSDGMLVQSIHPECAVSVPVVDLTSMRGEAQRGKASRLARSHGRVRMDLAQGPLLHVKLLKLSAEQHLIAMAMHQIVCDGLSGGILLRDVAACYRSLADGTAPALPELAAPFSDYAARQERWRSGGGLAAAQAFWRSTLGSGLSPVRLPHDPDAANPPEGAAQDSNVEILALLPELWLRAHAFCAGERIGLRTLSMAIFAALLSRVSGQKDFTLGVPCAGRTDETRDLIGPLMNIQILRTRLGDRSQVRDLLSQIETWSAGARQYESFSLEDLLQDLPFAQSAPSFALPVFFLYETPLPPAQCIASQGRDLEIAAVASESPGPAFEMLLAVIDHGAEGANLQLEYNPRLFRAATVRRFLDQYVCLLESALSAPDARVDDLSTLTGAERDRLLREGNRTEVDFGPFEPVHEIFLRRVSAHPDRVAAECGGVCWTNAELAGYARSLAARLVEEGLGPGDLVGICVPRSLETLGSVLAVMMAGAAYLPLDPTHPRERLEGILSDAGVSLLLTGGQPDELAPGIRRIDAMKPMAMLPARPPAAVQADSLAYVIYTSGSTGKPKGVAIEHAALRNLLLSMEREPGLGPDDVLVAVTTLSFDIAALELLLPLVTGARLVIAARDQVQDPALLLALLEATRATVLQATPGAWRALVEAGWSGALPLKVLCGGEALTRDLADLLLERSTQAWNMYGPTETTIWSSATPVTPGSAAPRIGTPIANTQFYVLDGHLHPVPTGTEGELYIGGGGLARGYWNRPDLTAAGFLPSPFGPGRLYKTGDLARRHPDGTIQLLGRVDFQVKIRGYRIELGEIEAVLARHPRVREAVVLHHVTPAGGDSPEMGRLVAYVDLGVHVGEASALIEDLKSSVGSCLPDYMRPNAIMALPEMPRTANGKIDRKALPDPFTQAGDSGLRQSAGQAESFQPPRDDIERELTAIWQSTLGIQKISVRASFFSLGVGSLAALRLVTRMNRAYGTDFGLASLLSASTIEAIADMVRNRMAPNTSSAVVPIQAGGANPPLFIVHGVGGNVVNFHGLSMRMGSNQPVYGIQAQALVAGQSALLHLKDMAAHYVEEIRKVQPHGPYHLLGYSFGGMVVLEMAHQLRSAGESIALVGMLDSKSKTYEQERVSRIPVQSKIGNRVRRFRGNTGHLDLRSRMQYISNKVSTRAIRFSCMAAARLRLSRVPAFMKSAYDINYVAIQNYTPRPYPGRLVLFRASDQEDPHGAHDLGWSSIFREGVEVHDLPGDHERIFVEPNIDTLAKSLRACLRKG